MASQFQHGTANRWTPKRIAEREIVRAAQAASCKPQNELDRLNGALREKLGYRAWQSLLGVIYREATKRENAQEYVIDQLRAKLAELEQAQGDNAP